MIRNIVFDLGNVLLSWQPEEFLAGNGYSKESREIILNEVFRSPEWLKLDNGDLTLSEAVERIASASSLGRDEIIAVFNLRTRIIFPLNCNTKLLPGLKKQGFRLYFLSNFPDDIFDEIESKYDFFGIFDGGLISARVRASKPDTRIYQILLEKYSLIPEECLFIDDSHKNATSAELTGMKGIHLDRPELLKEKLENTLGVEI